MSGFIKFSTLLLNTNEIHSIVIQPNKYIIRIKKSNGFHWTGIGWISSNNDNVIEICESKNVNDYNILTDWIRQIK